MTDIKISYFKILINLDKPKPRLTLPNFSFSYNATLHLKGVSTKNKRVFVFSNSTSPISTYMLDLSSWNYFILENIIFVTIGKEIQQLYLTASN